MKLLPVLLLFAIALSLGACDSSDGNLVDPNQQLPAQLVGLTDGYRFAYFSHRSGTREFQHWNDTVRIVTAPDGEYFRVRYLYLDFSMEAPEYNILIGPFWRNDETGLGMYFTSLPSIDALENLVLAENPELFWKFLYPAEVGDKWINPVRPYQVELVAKDTLIVSTDLVQTARCYAYHVIYTGGVSPQVMVKLYFVPGEVLFKIETFGDPKLTAVTYFWAKN